jgi:ubiquinone biosynthesis protein COQ9
MVDGSFQPVVNSYELGTSMPRRSRPPHHFFRKEGLPPLLQSLTASERHTAMTDEEFDAALITSAFAIAAKEGWSAVAVIGAARAGTLPLEQARNRFSSTRAILLRFGQHADSLALADAPEIGPTRERLFDLLMRRFDALQTQRAGVLALLHSLPTDPGTALLLAAATAKSMGWMLQAAGVKTAGLSGLLATKGLVAVWLYALTAWQRDDSADLSTTMAALDRALSRAEQAANWFIRPAVTQESGPKPFPEPVVDATFNETGAISGAADTPPDAGTL